MEIDRHKVFISYYHKEEQDYKEQLSKMKEWNSDKNQYISIFDDYSVNQNDIDDVGMTDEQIRREIRDNYIKDATVLILVCGENTKRRKHIDWEIHAAMYDSDVNPKMGILVIDVGQDSLQIACGEEEENIMGSGCFWVQLKKEEKYLQENYPNLPDRIIENIALEAVSITVTNWNVIKNQPQKLKELIDRAYNRKKTNQYDHSTPLRRRNS